MDVPTRLTDNETFDVEVQRVAGGGFGVVYMGPDRLHEGKWRALKTRRDGGGQRAIDAFVREALVWVGLWPHTNLMLALSVVHVRRRPYILMPYVEGGNLRAHLRHHHGLAKRLQWAQMIAGGLLALHTPDPDLLRPWPIVHRDLKPENILMDGGVVAKITDFGLARAFEQEEGDEGEDPELAGVDGDGTGGTKAIRSRRLRTEGGIVVGTPAYMAPEQWVPGGEIGPAVDVWAFGVILSELLGGRYPFAGMWAARPNSSALGTTPSPLPLREQQPELPVGLESLYRACLERRPEDRPTAGEALTVLQEAAEKLGMPRYQPHELLPREGENLGWMFFRWAHVYARFTLRSEALPRSERAVELLPEAPLPLAHHGSLIAKMGRHDEGLALVERALAMAPSEQHRALCLSERATILTISHRYGEAEVAWVDFLKLRPDDGFGWQTLALMQAEWAYREWEAGNAQKAHERLLRAYRCAERTTRIDRQDNGYVGLFHALREELRAWGNAEPWTYLRFESNERGYRFRFQKATFQKPADPQGPPQR